MSGLRLDRLLCFLRLSPTRTRAHDWVCEGHMRRNGERAADPACLIHIGDVLTLPISGGALVIELLRLPERRGPIAESAACYRVLDAGRPLRQADAIAPPDGADKGSDTK